ncbi:MAG TPA: hypothetical protein VKR22_15465 [Acidimicrobiales bacterium]|nr:hypothetical protein [Acidimicrobiales bacterium]
MTLGERCDEIVRLIDATLADCSSSADGPKHEPPAAVAGEAPTASRARRLAKAQRQGLPRSA